MEWPRPGWAGKSQAVRAGLVLAKLGWAGLGWAERAGGRDVIINSVM